MSYATATCANCHVGSMNRPMHIAIMFHQRPCRNDALRPGIHTSATLSILYPMRLFAMADSMQDRGASCARVMRGASRGTMPSI